MPFHGFRRYSFTLASIHQNTPASAGVYGIANAKEWIFVGGGEDLRAALLAHLNTPGTAILSRAPTGFVFEPCSPGGYSERQARLIAELQPSCNFG